MIRSSSQGRDPNAQEAADEQRSTRSEESRGPIDKSGRSRGYQCYGRGDEDQGR
jgi:hypothetical protein